MRPCYVMVSHQRAKHVKNVTFWRGYQAGAKLLSEQQIQRVDARRESSNVMDEVYDLRQCEELTGLGVERLRRMVVSGEVIGFQPAGPRGKLFVPHSEIQRLRTPVHLREAK